MIQRPPISTRTDTLVPYTTLFRSACFGDAAIEEGVFHESMNFAELRKLPVIFLLENNLYSVYTPLAERQPDRPLTDRSEEHTSELQSLMRISYAVFCLKKKKPHTITTQVVYKTASYP